MLDGTHYTEFQGIAGTYCEVEPEFMIESTKEHHKYTHFSADELCGRENDQYKVNANMCASENIIGPISDLIHASEEDDVETEFLDNDRRGRSLQSSEIDMRTSYVNA